MPRYFKILLNTIIAFFVIMLFALGSLVIWATGEQKKIPTNVVSRIEDAFEALSPNIQVYIGDAKTEFIGFSEGFEIVLEDSYIQFGPEILASAPQMKMDLKLKDLIFLDLKLRELKLFEPQFVVSSKEDREMLDLAREDSFLIIYKNVVYELFEAIDKDTNIIPVEKINMEGAQFSFNNKGVYETWDLKKANLSFYKLQNSTYLQTEVQTVIYDDLVDLSSKARLLEGDSMMVEVDFKNLPSKITTLFVDDVEWLKDLDINLSGKSAVVMQKDSVESSVSLDTGFTFNKKNLGDIELDYKGQLNIVQQEDSVTPILQSNITLKNLKMNKLKELWSENYGGDVRDEVLKRISNGTYEDVKISFEFGFADMDFSSVVSEDYSVSGHIMNADVIFNKRYPTMKDVEGYFEFDGDNVLGQIKKAQIKDKLYFTDTKLDINSINSDVSIMEISGKMSGDIIAVKHIVSGGLNGEDKDFYYNRKNIKATGAGRFYYKDDINDGFSYKHTKLDVQADIDEMFVEDVVEGIDFSSSKASLKADELGLEIESEGLLNNSASYAKIWVGFKSEDNYTISIDSEAKANDITLLVPDYEQYVKGLSSLQFEYKSRAQTNSLIGKIDFSAAEVSFPYISWFKKPEEFASISFIGRNANFKALEIKNLQLTTEDSVSTGRAIVALDDKSPNEIYFNRLTISDNDAEIYYSSTKSQINKDEYGYKNIVKVNGKTFNASGLLKDFKSASEGNSSLLLNVNVDELIMSGGVKMSDFSSQLNCNFDGCLLGRANGKFDNGGVMRVDFAPKDDSDLNSEKIFELETDNAGMMIKAFGFSDNIKEGYGRIDAVTGRGNKTTTSGNIFIRDYQIVKAPVLAKIFSLASFSGISELLTGAGIPMKKLTGEFSMNDDFINFSDIVSHGDSLGITSQGNYNRNEAVIDLSGAVTPSYSVNSFLGKIPILGKIFTANEGEGLIAAQYSVKGKYPDVDVSVNPLSALTPGFLRKIWGSSSNVDLEDEKDRRKYPASRN